MCDLLRLHDGLPLQSVVDHLEEQVLEYHGSEMLEDDFTLVLARITG